MPSTKRIEAELEAERDVLRAQLTTLEAQFAPEQIVGKATALMSGLGGGAVDTARRNPGPLAVTGMGLAWMAVKAATRQTGPRISYDETVRPTVTGFSQPEPQMAGFDARVAAADRAMKADQTGTYQEGDDSMTDTNTTRLSHAKERLYDSTEGLRARIEDGLDGLPDGAKHRIRQAREAAISVQARAEVEAARAARVARTTAHDNPLLLGGLALAAGAALAMMLPRTQIEDRTIGAHRDRLFDEADRIFQEEKAKLQAAAEDVVAEGQQRVKETLASADKSSSDRAA
ncbi:hypothetical protein [Jannaschia sp. CCS1]|uniref:hypothetical protein n=1 Tax=Jannaschia sp. (strain CCS1) TaxID=290400 RepID=UPI000053D491|nr:hypothetical protein [Jannaschia sp. CCS1]ABD56476.1 hypothetical protein Jann_3559 [Jannaschia sp. CCS1]